MLDIFKSWYKKYFSNPEAIILVLVLVVIFSLWVLVGEIFAPVIVSLVIAYLLGWWINLLVNHNIPRSFAYLIIYTGFLAIFVVAIFILLPLLWRQFSNLFTRIIALVLGLIGSVSCLHKLVDSLFLKIYKILSKNLQNLAGTYI